MTREEARMELIRTKRAIFMYDLPSEAFEALDMAIESLSEDRVRIEVHRDLYGKYIDLKHKTEWIPCSERLPEEEEKTYWVCTDAEYQCECRWTNANHFWTGLTTDWHWHIMDIPQYTKVIAWMPLPKPYRGGDDE